MFRHIANHTSEILRFSPRTRGCSEKALIGKTTHTVFPAHAGMFRASKSVLVIENCFPRARGDVPFTHTDRPLLSMFSPRTRGCSSPRVGYSQSAIVFPAHAGMFPCKSAASPALICFPRARGDVPKEGDGKGKPVPFSPRTRGCSAVAIQTQRCFAVFPAHAGMFRAFKPMMSLSSGFPRARGDVPSAKSSRAPCRAFSPRTRGCSCQHSGPFKQIVVFPAHAGMFRLIQGGFQSDAGFPRARGDVPFHWGKHHAEP